MKPAITDITGIGPAAAAALGEHGLSSIKELATASVEQVSAVPGFSTARAEKVIAAAAELLATPGTQAAASDKPEKDRKEKKKKKEERQKGQEGQEGQG